MGVVEAGTPTPEPTPASTPVRQPLTRNRTAVIAIVAIVVLVAIGVVLYFVLGHSKAKSNSVLGIGPKAFHTVARLKLESVSINTKFYWVGPQPGVRYSFQRTTTNEIFVRYLPSGVSVKDLKVPVLTIATYPGIGAYTSLKKKATSLVGPGGSAMWVDPKKHGTNIYLAWPNKNVEVEVFDPKPRLAKLYARRVQPIR